MSEMLAPHSFADLVPSMTEEEYQGLKADIALHGQLEPIVLYEGKILDGRHRYRACRELGLTPTFRRWEESGSAVDLVLSVNLHRRHLTSGQRAAIAVAAAKMRELEVQARERSLANLRKGITPPEVEFLPHRGAPSHPDSVSPPDRETGKTRERIATEYRVNSRYVQDAKAILNAKPELLEQVKQGQITLPQAKQELRREQKLADLQQKAETAESTTGGNQSWEIRQGDCLVELESILDPVRLIFADPPYNIGIDYGAGPTADSLPADEYLAWCRAWIDRCADCLTPDGSLWILINDEWADHFGVMLRDARLHRRAWIKWYESFGTNCSGNFNRCSRHLFYCVRDPKRFIFNEDAVSRPSDRQAKYADKRADPGGKLWDNVWGINPPIPRLTGTCQERIPEFPTQLPLALVEPIVLCASEPGDLVVDPFNGSGTTGVAALRHGRRYIGIEQSDRFAELARLRLKGLAHA